MNENNIFLTALGYTSIFSVLLFMIFNVIGMIFPNAVFLMYAIPFLGLVFVIFLCTFKIIEEIKKSK